MFQVFLFVADLLNSPSCLIKFHLVAKLTFWRGVLLCGERKEVRNEVVVVVGGVTEKEIQGGRERLPSDWQRTGEIV